MNRDIINAALGALALIAAMIGMYLGLCAAFTAG